MKITFLGYADYNFDTKEGNHVDGVKFFYYFPSRKQNYTGFETGGIFVQRHLYELIDQVKNAVPGKEYILNVGYDGRNAIFNGLNEID